MGTNPVDLLNEYKVIDASLKSKLNTLYNAKIIKYEDVDTYYNELIVVIFKNRDTIDMDTVIADRIAGDCVLNLGDDINVAKDIVLKSATLSILGRTITEISEILNVAIDEIRYACDILSIQPNEDGDIDAVICGEEEVPSVN